MKVYTDNKWKPFKYRYEVPRKVLEHFDYLDEDEASDGFFHYRRAWYHLSDFMNIGRVSDFKVKGVLLKWDGYHPETYFSGVLIKVSDDGEEYKVGSYSE